jgi:hypothetical protein
VPSVIRLSSDLVGSKPPLLADGLISNRPGMPVRVFFLAAGGLIAFSMQMHNRSYAISRI